MRQQDLPRCEGASASPVPFVCVTDDLAGLVEGIDAVDFPPRPPEMKNLYTYEKNGWPNIFVKLLVYKPGEFCIIRNWDVFRESVFGGKNCQRNSNLYIII